MELWWDPFVKSRKCISLKFKLELCAMTMRCGTKIEEELTCCFEIDRGTSRIWIQPLESLKNVFFNWLLVTKVYIVWATNVERSYLSWHWRVMQILKKIWLMVWKKDTRNLAHFHQSTWKCQIWDFDGILLSRVETLWP